MDETARVHSGARRRGGVAGGGAGAAGRPDAARRRAYGPCVGRSGRPSAPRSVCTGLQQSGWVIGQNIRVDYRWSGGNADKMRNGAAELVAARPDVILAHSSGAVAPLLQATSTIPVVFVIVADPVGAGFVENLARPGRNATGFTNFEYSMGGKWLELLKEISPRWTRVAVLRESAMVAGPGQFGAIQAVAQSMGVDLRPTDVRDATEIERDITLFAEGLNGGLIITGSPAATVYRDLIVALAARHRLPAIYNSRFYIIGGGLISYGPDYVDQFRRSAGYVDRILKGEKPADLPVQAPTKYELVINLKTAKTLGLDDASNAARPRRRGDRVKRRTFIAALGGAVAWPVDSARTAAGDPGRRLPSLCPAECRRNTCALSPGSKRDRICRRR